eukprot:scaffold90794_cov33-Phaeocystis_antarctica.AAC.2
MYLLGSTTCVFEHPASCLLIAPSAFTAAGGRPAARTPRAVGWLSPLLGRAAGRAEGRGWATAPLGWATAPLGWATAPLGWDSLG